MPNNHMEQKTLEEKLTPIAKRKVQQLYTKERAEEIGIITLLGEGECIRP